MTLLKKNHYKVIFTKGTFRSIKVFIFISLSKCTKYKNFIIIICKEVKYSWKNLLKRKSLNNYFKYLNDIRL